MFTNNFLLFTAEAGGYRENAESEREEVARGEMRKSRCVRVGILILILALIPMETKSKSLQQES
jgi:hypothetical protein